LGKCSWRLFTRRCCASCIIGAILDQFVPRLTKTQRRSRARSRRRSITERIDLWSTTLHSNSFCLNTGFSSHPTHGVALSFAIALSVTGFIEYRRIHAGSCRCPDRWKGFMWRGRQAYGVEIGALAATQGPRRFNPKTCGCGIEAYSADRQGWSQLFC